MWANRSERSPNESMTKIEIEIIRNHLESAQRKFFLKARKIKAIVIETR